MCTTTIKEEKNESSCRGKCACSGEAKLTEAELQQQKQECHGTAETEKE